MWSIAGIRNRGCENGDRIDHVDFGKAWNVLRNGHNSHTLLGLGGEITMHIEIEMLNGLSTMMIGLPEQGSPFTLEAQTVGEAESNGLGVEGRTFAIMPI